MFSPSRRPRMESRHVWRSLEKEINVTWANAIIVPVAPNGAAPAMAEARRNYRSRGMPAIARAGFATSTDAGSAELRATARHLWTRAATGRITDLFLWPALTRHATTRGSAKNRDEVMPRLSVLIPAYEMGGVGAGYLAQALGSLAQQDLPDFEVIVADQSDDNSLATVCAGFAGRLRLRRLDTRDLPRSSSANTNAALEAARGEVVKFLFQDDLLILETALSETLTAFEDAAVTWFACGGRSLDADGQLHGSQTPRMDAMTVMGVNTVGHPSVVALRRARAPRFDERLNWMMDVDYYHRCQTTLGPPLLSPRLMVATRRHALQQTSLLTPQARRAEALLMQKKYPEARSISAQLVYLNRYVLPDWASRIARLRTRAPRQI
ncbi:MAG TPA: hypothetical protein DHV56_03645 [Rhodobacter sp.]|nr:hypothetical protein [Rhodobacter sp.]